jgi:hypothetical protein
MLLLICSAFFVCFFNQNLSGQNAAKTGTDTIFISYPDSLRSFIISRHQYHQTLTMKLFMAQALYDGKLKRKDNGKTEMYLTCEQALAVIRRIDNLTLGIPNHISGRMAVQRT